VAARAVRGKNVSVPVYRVNEDAVTQATQLIDGRQYVLRSRWQNSQPGAREQNAFLKTHGWEEYPAWHLGLTEGAAEVREASGPPAARRAAGGRNVGGPRAGRGGCLFECAKCDADRVHTMT